MSDFIALTPFLEQRFSILKAVYYKFILALSLPVADSRVLTEVNGRFLDRIDYNFINLYGTSMGIECSGLQL
jgi:hypothetical protein